MNPAYHSTEVPLGAPRRPDPLGAVGSLDPTATALLPLISCGYVGIRDLSSAAKGSRSWDFRPCRLFRLWRTVTLQANADGGLAME